MIALWSVLGGILRLALGAGVLMIQDLRQRRRQRDYWRKRIADRVQEWRTSRSEHLQMLKDET